MQLCNEDPRRGSQPPPLHAEIHFSRAHADKPFASPQLVHVLSVASEQFWLSANVADLQMHSPYVLQSPAKVPFAPLGPKHSAKVSAHCSH